MPEAEARPVPVARCQRMSRLGMTMNARMLIRAVYPARTSPAVGRRRAFGRGHGAELEQSERRARRRPPTHGRVLRQEDLLRGDHPDEDAGNRSDLVAHERPDTDADHAVHRQFDERGEQYRSNWLVTVLLAAFVAPAVDGVIGVGVGALVRNQIAAVAGVLVWMVPAEQILLSEYPAVGRWTPTGAAFGLLQLGPMATTKGALLGAPTAGLVPRRVHRPDQHPCVHCSCQDGTSSEHRARLERVELPPRAFGTTTSATAVSKGPGWWQKWPGLSGLVVGRPIPSLCWSQWTLRSRGGGTLRRRKARRA